MQQPSLSVPIYLYNTLSGIQKVVSDSTGSIASDVNVVPALDIQEIEEIVSNEAGIYFTGRVDGEDHTSIYKINPDLTYVLISDGLHDYTYIVPKSDEETFAALKSDGAQMNLVMFKGDFVT